MKIKCFHAVLFLTAQPSLAADLQAAADDVCACLESPYALVEKAMNDLQKAQASGDFSKIMQSQGEMMGVMGATSECFEKMPARYPDIDKNDELKKKVMEITNRQCPNPASGFAR